MESLMPGASAGMDGSLSWQLAEMAGPISSLGVDQASLYSWSSTGCLSLLMDRLDFLICG